MTPENNVIIIVLPGVIAMLLLGVFSFLYRQSRQAYFRAWQIGWAAYTASYVLLAVYFFGAQTLAPLLAAKLLFAITILSVLASTRLINESFRWRKQDVFLAVAIAAWVIWAAQFAIHSQSAAINLAGIRIPAEPAVGFSILLAYSSWKFVKLGRQLQSTAFRLLAASLVFWGCLLLSRQFHTLFTTPFATYGHFLGPLPQMLIAIAMVIGGVSGLAVGILLGGSKFMARAYEAYLYYLGPCPKIIFFPIMIMWFGVGPGSKVAMGAISCFFPVALNVAGGMREIDKVLIKVGRSFRANTWQMVTKIYLPAMRHPIINGVRLGLGVALIGTLLAETKLSNRGIGFLVIQAYSLFNMPQMYSLLIILFVISIGANALIGRFGGINDIRRL